MYTNINYNYIKLKSFSTSQAFLICFTNVKDLHINMQKKYRNFIRQKHNIGIEEKFPKRLCQ